MKIQRAANTKIFAGWLKIIVSAMLVSALIFIPTGCISENPEVFPSIKNEISDSDQDNNQQDTDYKGLVPEIGDEKIVYAISSPFSEKTLERLRLLFLAKHRILSDPTELIKIEEIELDQTTNGSWLEAIGQTDNFADRFWSEFDNVNFQIKLLDRQTSTGPDREQQAKWLKDKDGPDIFFGSDASIYYENGNLIELNDYLYHNQKISSENVHVRMLDAFQIDGKVYGLPSLVSYPVIMQKDNGQNIALPSGQAAWSWQLIVDDLTARCQEINSNLTDTVEETNAEGNNGNITDNNLDDIDSVLVDPFSLDQPWITYMQIAEIPEQSPAVWSHGNFFISSGDTAIDQNLFGSWMNMLRIFPGMPFYDKQTPDSQPDGSSEISMKSSGLGVEQFENNFGLLNQMIVDEKIIAWLGDSSQMNKWQSAVPDLSAGIIPVNIDGTGSRYSLPLNLRGWFVSDSIVNDGRRPDLAAAFVAFLSYDPDAYYIIAMDENLSGFLPPITDRSLWQQYLGFNQSAKLDYNQWQEAYSRAFTNRDILLSQWSDNLFTAIIEKESRWYNLDENADSEG